MGDLIELEEKGWKALSTGERAAKEFYDSVLADDAVMVFPGGMLMEGKDTILESIGSQPWKSFRLDRQRLVRLSDNAAVVVYRVIAQREDAFGKGKWNLVVHQQTPQSR